MISRLLNNPFYKYNRSCSLPGALSPLDGDRDGLSICYGCIISNRPRNVILVINRISRGGMRGRADIQHCVLVCSCHKVFHGLLSQDGRLCELLSGCIRLNRSHMESSERENPQCEQDHCREAFQYGEAPLIECSKWFHQCSPRFLHFTVVLRRRRLKWSFTVILRFATT